MFRMLSSRGLKAVVLLIGTLTVSLGMYEAFQIDNAEATHSSWTCIFKEHKSAGTVTYSATETIATGTSTTNCPECSGQPAKKHQTEQKQVYIITAEVWRHKSISGNTWSSCHNHELSKALSGSPFWVTIHCGG